MDLSSVCGEAPRTSYYSFPGIVGNVGSVLSILSMCGEYIIVYRVFVYVTDWRSNWQDCLPVSMTLLSIDIMHKFFALIHHRHIM